MLYIVFNEYIRKLIDKKIAFNFPLKRNIARGVEKPDI